ncbi:LOW QUALITY PROTEIN: hypothetical protein JCM24511_08504 [Saitozyma sp. JCM 24511]|nr:LOW QUALITY PROTEIN: hypothetical protein JCM24511_08504 [Saitozyma sp. JCM 24511]
MSEQDTSEQAVSRGVSPESNANFSQLSSRPPSVSEDEESEGSSEVDPSRERERALVEAFRGNIWETGRFLSPMFSTTSSPLTVNYDWELFDPPLTVEWSVVDEDGGDDLSNFMLTVRMPRLLNVKTFDDEGEEITENRFVYDSLSSAIVLAFHDCVANEYVHTADNLKHRIFFAMQQLETETSFIPPKVRDYVKDKGGSKFDSHGSWSIKVGPNEDASISQTIRFELEKPLWWNPLKADNSSASGSRGNEIVLGDGLDEVFRSEPDRV